MKYLLNRKVDIYNDLNDSNVCYKVFSYLFSYGDPDEGGGEERDSLFGFIIKLEDNSILDGGYYDGDALVHANFECEFSDPYEEDFYELNELETIFSNDVSKYGDKLSTIIDIQKVKEMISEYEDEERWFYN